MHVSVSAALGFALLSAGAVVGVGVMGTLVAQNRAAVRTTPPFVCSVWVSSTARMLLLDSASPASPEPCGMGLAPDCTCEGAARKVRNPVRRELEEACDGLIGGVCVCSVVLLVLFVAFACAVSADFRKGADSDAMLPGARAAGQSAV